MEGVGSPIGSLEKLLASGKDSALLRLGLGSAYLKAGDAPQAVDHLQRAVALDPGYSAAWKLLGKALAEAGREADALAAYREGIAASEKKGDKQAMKEMQVFARRLAKQMGQK
ncbi:MAG TPA: bacterial transcriptional activator domain-containing protein [Casimicrobiaceae bacterium]|nr:bacterial transcriptional activator domain-containing protein [Casimicrobiaceae bacterium]